MSHDVLDQTTSAIEVADDLGSLLVFALWGVNDVGATGFRRDNGLMNTTSRLSTLVSFLIGSQVASMVVIPIATSQAIQDSTVITMCYLILRMSVLEVMLHLYTQKSFIRY
jgi:hypothetical protein